MSLTDWPTEPIPRESAEDDALTVFKRIVAGFDLSIDAEFAIVAAGILYGAACEKQGIRNGVRAMRDAMGAKL